jgi:1,4-alpha-glucan branching enzyme
MEQGAFAFVLHSHLPYVRKAGRWPHGEEMIHEASAETYIPLLNALFELKQEGCQPYLTIGLTPILLEQLADPDVLDHFELYLLERLSLVEADILRHKKDHDEAMLRLAEFYRVWYKDLRQSFVERYGRNLVAAFRQLQGAGNLDIITSGATHGYLPLMERDSTVYAQLKVGAETSKRHLGRAPRGIWLPECGYRPAFVQGGMYKPGIEEFLGELNLGYFFTDTHVIVGGKLVGKVAGDAIGPYGGLPKRKWVVHTDERPEATQRTTMRPYYVHSGNVAVYGRDERTGLQVWSATHGYPGDFQYREFHRKDSYSGLQYWRITGPQVDLGQKRLYDPELALRQVQMHADHFVSLIADEVQRYHAATGKPGIVVSAYDTELFGHWWFEGITWLREVLRRLDKHETVKLTSAGDYLEAFPPEEVISLPESSWGAGGGHWTWLNPDTEWIWPLVHSAELRMEQLVERHPQAEGKLLDVLNQAARELLLLESSDWPFLISTGQAKEYASGRFQQHLARFSHLAAVVDSGVVTSTDEHFLATIAELDNPFPDIDYRVFHTREKPAP